MIYDEHLASLYDRTYARLRNQAAEVALIASVAKTFPAPVRLLDVGCGTGIHLGLLDHSLAPVCELFGIDGSEAMLAIAQRRVGNRATLLACPLSERPWPLPDQSIDVAFATFNLFQSFMVPEARKFFLSELHRVLAPDGRLLFDSHCEPGFSAAHAIGSATEIVDGGLRIRISSTWAEHADRKETSVDFSDSASGAIINRQTHVMLRMTWPQICAQLAEAGFRLISTYANWERASFDEHHSPNVVALAGVVD